MINFNIMQQTLESATIAETTNDEKKKQVERKELEERLYRMGTEGGLEIKIFEDLEHNSLSISVPVAILGKIHPGEEIFGMLNGEHNLGAKEEDGSYVIAFTKNTPINEIEKIVDKIEERYKNKISLN
jgi:hypothetical protein